MNHFPTIDPSGPAAREICLLRDQAKRETKLIQDTQPVLFRADNKTIFNFIVEFTGAAILNANTARTPGGCELYYNIPGGPDADVISELDKIKIYGF